MAHGSYRQSNLSRHELRNGPTPGRDRVASGAVAMCAHCAGDCTVDVLLVSSRVSETQASPIPALCDDITDASWQRHAVSCKKSINRPSQAPAACRTGPLRHFKLCRTNSHMAAGPKTQWIAVSVLGELQHGPTHCHQQHRNHRLSRSTIGAIVITCSSRLVSPTHDGIS